MNIPFVKMEGLGNDYVYIDCFPVVTASQVADMDLSKLAQRVSDRHTGIGSDGLVLILRSNRADACMRIFNADGSEAQMCGNAARCVGKYLYEKGYCHKPDIQLETLAGIKTLLIGTSPDDNVRQVTVVMGTTIGNPHKVFVTEQPLESINLVGIKDTNVEWVQVLNRREIAMRVYERGSGETMACGTGACAAAIETMNQGLTENEVLVHMRGGKLFIKRDEGGIIYMTGPATEVFSGIYNWEA